MEVLALCGSLRAASRSRALLEAAALLAPEGMQITLCAGLGDLPLFNPDMEQAPPACVQSYWQTVASYDMLLIASPEYAHGVTGTIKNALDWLVGSESFVNGAVAVWNPSHRAEHADAALLEILRTMGANVVGDTSKRLPVTASTLSANELALDIEWQSTIRDALRLMQQHGVKGTV